MDALRLPSGKRAAHRFSVQRDDDAGSRFRWPGKEVPRDLVEFLNRHGFAEKATKGGGMGGLGCRQGEERRKQNRTQLDPLSNAAPVILTRQFSQHDEHQNSDHGIT